VPSRAESFDGTVSRPAATQHETWTSIETQNPRVTGESDSVAEDDSAVREGYPALKSERCFTNVTDSMYNQSTAFRSCLRSDFAFIVRNLILLVDKRSAGSYRDFIEVLCAVTKRQEF
ncbi:hypothetical protein ALC53_00600, partial [Atta colombica]